MVGRHPCFIGNRRTRALQDRSSLFSAQAYSVKAGSWVRAAGQDRVFTSSCQGSPGAKLPLEQEQGPWRKRPLHLMAPWGPVLVPCGRGQHHLTAGLRTLWLHLLSALDGQRTVFKKKKKILKNLGVEEMPTRVRRRGRTGGSAFRILEL